MTADAVRYFGVGFTQLRVASVPVLCRLFCIADGWRVAGRYVRCVRRLGYLRRIAIELGRGCAKAFSLSGPRTVGLGVGRIGQGRPHWLRGARSARLDRAGAHQLVCV